MHEHLFAVKSGVLPADDRDVSPFLRYRYSLLVVVLALTATAAVFTFARPEHERYEGELLDMTKEHVYPLADVRRAFAAHGIPLRYTANLGDLPRGIAMLGTTPQHTWNVEAFYVYYVGAKAKVNWGDPAFAEGQYEQRFGNLLVHYGGGDERFLDRVEAAVAELR